MNLAYAARRTTVFVVLFGTGITILSWAAGGLFLTRAVNDGSAQSGGSGTHTQLPESGGVPLPGEGASLGPGRGGRLHRDDVAIVRDKPVPWREMTAEWGTTAPEPSREPGVTIQRLGDARLVFYPRPSDDAPDVVTRDDAEGVTVMTGNEALLRRKENAPASVHAEGDCFVVQVLGGGEAMVLRSDVLDFRTEERGKAKVPVRIVETDRAVRIDGGGSQMNGTGLLAEFDSEGGGRAARDASSRRVARILKDVTGLFQGRAPKKAGAKAPEIRVACDGTADIETLDRPGRDGRQPWRVTFRENVRFVETASTLTAERVVVDFVRTGAADRAAGAASTDIRSLTAIGGVRIDGLDPATAYHARCERLRRFAEDDATDVTVLEGAPVLTWQGRPQNADAPATGPSSAELSAYEVRCTGPVTIRERRPTAARAAEATVTFTFQGDVVATESASGGGAVLSRTTAPLVTIECRRDATGHLDPRTMRAEQGAESRYRDFAARAQTITAEAAKPGAMQHIALVGSPVASYNLRAGANPLGGGDDAPGLLVLSSDGRIDADLAPDPPAGQKASGTRVATKVEGGMLARRMTGDVESWKLTAQEGDAKIGWDGGIEEMHAVGRAHLVGAARGGTPQDGAERDGDLLGERITVSRPQTSDSTPGTKPPDATRLDALVEGLPEAPATALLGADRVRARTLLQTGAGTVLVARGGAHLERTRTGTGITADADDMRVDLDIGEDGTRTPRFVVATGRVVLGDAFHRVAGDRVTYEMARGEAEATGRPARIVRSDPAAPSGEESYAAGPVVRAWFDTDQRKSGADRFLRASLPQGGEIQAFEKKPDRRGISTSERVTTTCRGPLELTRTTASCVQQVVCVHESRVPPGTAWNADSRIDCSRLDLTFEAAAKGGAASSRIRTFVAQGTADDPAQIHTKSPAGDREAYAQAERIEGAQDGTTMHLTCPSDKTSVHLHDVAAGRRMRGDAVTFNYVTFEWTDWARLQYVE